MSTPSKLTLVAKVTLVLLGIVAGMLSWRLARQCLPFFDPCPSIDGTMVILIYSPFVGLSVLVLVFGSDLVPSFLLLVFTLIGAAVSWVASDGCALVAFALYGSIAVASAGIVGWWRRRASNQHAKVNITGY